MATADDRLDIERTVARHGGVLDGILSALERIERDLATMRERGRFSMPTFFAGVGAFCAAAAVTLGLFWKAIDVRFDAASARAGVVERRVELLEGRTIFPKGP